MDIRQLQYYREIVKQGNISKAAEALNMAQPPLSQLLKKLEEELGTTLIHRYRRKWELTESGKLFYQYAEQLLNQTEEVKRRIHEIEGGTAGAIHIGVSSTCSNMLVDYITEFRKQFTQVEFNILSADSESLLKKLKQKEIDLALLLKPIDIQSYEIKTLKKEPTILIAPKHWEASLSTQPTLKEIADLPLIVLGEMEGHAFYGDLLDAFDREGVKPNIIVECKDIPMVVALVNRGLGISIIPRIHHKSLFFDHLTIYEFEQFDFSVEPVVMKLKDEPISKAAMQFWEGVK